MLKIVTLPFNEEMEEFEQEKLQRMLGDIQIVKCQAELVKMEGKYYWTAFIQYENMTGNVIKYEKGNTFRNPKEIKQNIKYSEQDLSGSEKELYEIFKEWRAGEAQILGYPTYIIASNQLLIDIVKTNPKTVEELSQLKGMGKRKIRDYGEEILLILENFYDMLKTV